MSTTDKAVENTIALGMGVLSMIVSLPLTLLRAFTFATLWRWLVMPHANVPPVSVALAVGVLYVAGVVTYRGWGPADREANKKTSALDDAGALIGGQFTGALVCLFALGIGYLWHLWFTR